MGVSVETGYKIIFEGREYIFVNILDVLKYMLIITRGKIDDNTILTWKELLDCYERISIDTYVEPYYIEGNKKLEESNPKYYDRYNEYYDCDSSEYEEQHTLWEEELE